MDERSHITSNLMISGLADQFDPVPSGVFISAASVSMWLKIVISKGCGGREPGKGLNVGSSESGSRIYVCRAFSVLVRLISFSPT
jgi:hypothetical protein